MSAHHLTIEDATTWWQAGDRQIFIADVLDSSNSASMTVGFARYDKGATNEWVVTYDQALVVTKGTFTVHTADRAITAKAGEAIFLTQGTKVLYEGEQDGTEIVYVTFPHWWDVHRESEHAHLLATFRSVRGVTQLMPSRARPAALGKHEPYDPDGVSDVSSRGARALRRG
jgi:ethanolamine utilization protein EutQ